MSEQQSKSSGLKDMHGNEIREGDTIADGNNNSYNGVVKYGECRVVKGNGGGHFDGYAEAFDFLGWYVEMRFVSANYTDNHSLLEFVTQRKVEIVK